jgi:hypothetical protein
MERTDLFGTSWRKWALPNAPQEIAVEPVGRAHVPGQPAPVDWLEVLQADPRDPA